VRTALRGLDPRNADTVGRHLVAAGGLLEEDPQLALEHARAARDRASRLGFVREAVGVAAYHAGDFAEAARELRAYARMSGDESYRAVLADCERALGRPENALRLVQQALEAQPDPEELVELRLVEAGTRQDLGEVAAAKLVLEAALGGRPTPAGLGHPDLGQLRLATAYADLLDARGDAELAREWYAAIATADPDDLTGVSDHFAEDDDEDDDEDAERDLADFGIIAEEPAEADVEVLADEAADDVAHDAAGDVSSDPVADDELGRELSEEVGGEVTQEDIEAEVAELLGETPPRVERDHTRLFQEPAPDEEQQPPTD
jgi:tetratricopeptide (TPR) repeat protein